MSTPVIITGPAAQNVYDYPFVIADDLTPEALNTSPAAFRTEEDARDYYLRKYGAPVPEPNYQE